MLLTRASMVWFWDHYLPNADAGQEAYASPLKAGDLSGLAPALIQTAEYDPLRDEGEAYGAAIEAAGGDVTIHRYDGVVHDPFMMFAVIPPASNASRKPPPSSTNASSEELPLWGSCHEVTEGAAREGTAHARHR